ncbi:Uncharacterized protein encoded in hypervariable junctions of pilus gene clusters [Butyrivibrio fibrisolvens 16/4]|nr:Uncharacterized protein encoded in hypervariable junctions of pilus gene clusters [Butyrivibrio fibrisolvens 16/4]
MMNYKGYIGKVEFDDEQHIFTGEVINTRAVITFQGSSVSELEEEFRLSVDDYIEWCEQDGVELERPYSGKFNVRIYPQLHQRAVVGAKVLGISLNAFLIKCLEDELNLMHI